MAIESPIIFYPRRIIEISVTAFRRGEPLLRYWRIRRRIKADPNFRTYADEALRGSSADAPDHFAEAFAAKIANGLRQESRA